ncbi:MAG: zinc-dependent metalloprotease [Planctomycetota bacterium]
MLCSIAAVTAALLSGSEAHVPFPFQPRRGAEQLGSPTLDLEPAAIAGLTRLDAVTLTGVTLPSGGTVSLELERIDVERRRFGVHVDGALVPGALEGLDLSVWKGRVAGDEASQVMLGFSRYGSRGWIRVRDELTHLMPVPASEGNWRDASALLVAEQELNAAGYSFDGACEAAPPTVAPVPSAHAAFDHGPQFVTIESVALRECTVAMETDWQLYQIFNDVNATTTYLTTLLSFVSDRYEEQASTLLTFPYLQIHTTSNDPWSSQDNGGSTIDLLNELQAAWIGNIPTGARLGHFMSGAPLGGGVAYLDVLCNDQFNFGVSANIVGQVSFPVVQQPSNWDFFVVAHELGHNFSAPHTHEFCPPLDECPPSNFFGSCQVQQQCTNMGTIMSYCHLCPGGTGNITTFFHPENAARMTAASANCAPAIFEVMITAPDLASDVTTTPTMLQVLAGTVSSANLNYRTAGTTAVTTVPMTAHGGGLFTADLPAAPCGDTLEYWHDFDVAGYGTYTAPADAPTAFYGAFSGIAQALFADAFDQERGWSVVDLGATTGAWERGVPVDDPGWQYDPVGDADGSGASYLTENRPGNTDVDDGATALVSPVFDMSVGSARLRYSYFLRLTNADGDDRLLVEARSNGGAWTEVARHDTDGGLAWRDVELTVADFLAAGITPGEMQLRFTANDGGDPSIVEAGVDAFRVEFLHCGPFGTPYCGPAIPNSTGSPAILAATGSPEAATNDFVLRASSVPPAAFGFFLNSASQASVPGAFGSSGTLCLGGTLGQHVDDVQRADPTGALTAVVDLSALPRPGGPVQVLAGETWNFQAWFRDTASGAATSNFSDGLEVTIQ